MAKLLDFKPEVGDRENGEDKRKFDTLLTMDICYGNTPDMPRLRYAGPQYVFIWDDMKNHVLLNERTSLIDQVDYETTNYTVKTKNKFVPFENWRTNIGEHKYFLPSQEKWWEQFNTKDVLALQGCLPTQVNGRLIKCNLAAIKALDQWYGNRENFVRTMLPVQVPAPGTSGKIIERWVWVYTCPVVSMGKYDPHENEYTMRAGVEPRPVRMVGSGFGAGYEVDALRAKSKPLDKCGPM